MKFTIVIPALNEEEAIGATIERCLAAKEGIYQKTDIDDVRIIVVSDGSTDRTAEIARSYSEVDVIEFPENRGYGAAIKAGWERGGDHLLGFLDANGTCDPKWFVPMCQRILKERDDIVLGCRMGPDSKMPGLRRLGNRVFATLLGQLAKKPVRDTASGMRVIGRTALPRLLPLPGQQPVQSRRSATAIFPAAFFSSFRDSSRSSSS